jgi:hypothetical protein
MAPTINPNKKSEQENKNINKEKKPDAKSGKKDVADNEKFSPGERQL